jgi:hypothetical protein
LSTFTAIKLLQTYVFPVSPAFVSCFPSDRSNSRPIPLRPLLAAIRADCLGLSAPSDDRAENNPAVRDDHDRDDGAAESPYMLIQGSACLTNR